MVKKRVINDVYKEVFYLIISDDIQRVHKKYNENYNGQGHTFVGDDGIYIILGKEQNSNFLAHEIDHAISFLWETRGIEKIGGADECYSYMIGWLTENFLPFYIEKTNYENK